MDTEIPLGRGRAMTAAEMREFLTTLPLLASVATLQEDGSPYVNPLWYEYQDDAFIVITKANAKVCQNLRRDPRATLVVAAPQPPYRRVLARGRAREIDVDWIPIAERMVLRYVGPDGIKYLRATSGLPRVTFAIQVEQLTSWNGQGLDRSFSAPAIWHAVGGG
jgi:PPOX class probable F420-dependent enzyme